MRVEDHRPRADVLASSDPLDPQKRAKVAARSLPQERQALLLTWTLVIRIGQRRFLRPSPRQLVRRYGFGGPAGNKPEQGLWLGPEAVHPISRSCRRALSRRRSPISSEWKRRSTATLISSHRSKMVTLTNGYDDSPATPPSSTSSRPMAVRHRTVPLRKKTIARGLFARRKCCRPWLALQLRA